MHPTVTPSPPAPSRTSRFRCRICRVEADCGIHVAREMMYGTREAFEYAECPECGSLQICDVPADLARHYPSDYYSMMPRDEPPQPPGLRGALMQWYARSAALRPGSAVEAVARALLPQPTDFAEHGYILRGAGLGRADERILDVGCGSSPYRLASFRRCGFPAVEGIDPYIDADLDYHGIPVYRRSIDQHDGAFGLVMFHHSLEHMPDPEDALRHARRLLRRGGTCLVCVPVSGTYFWRRFGVNWAELDAPRHLHLFSVGALEGLAGRTGLRLKSLQFDSGAWELAASVRYERDIPLRQTPRPVDGFSDAEIAVFERQAAELNERCDAGRACFFFEAA